MAVRIEIIQTDNEVDSDFIELAADEKRLRQIAALSMLDPTAECSKEVDDEQLFGMLLSALGNRITQSRAEDRSAEIKKAKQTIRDTQYSRKVSSTIIPKRIIGEPTPEVVPIKTPRFIKAAIKGPVRPCVQNPDAFYAKGKEQNIVKRLCNDCDIIQSCGTEALQNRIEWGVWGGMSERDRRRILQAHDNKAPVKAI